MNCASVSSSSTVNNNNDDSVHHNIVLVINKEDHVFRREKMYVRILWFLLSFCFSPHQIRNASVCYWGLRAKFAIVQLAMARTPFVWLQAKQTEIVMGSFMPPWFSFCSSAEHNYNEKRLEDGKEGGTINQVDFISFLRTLNASIFPQHTTELLLFEHCHCRCCRKAAAIRVQFCLQWMHSLVKHKGDFGCFFRFCIKIFTIGEKVRLKERIMKSI